VGKLVVELVLVPVGEVIEISELIEDVEVVIGISELSEEDE
jgi:hypothetical protein